MRLVSTYACRKRSARLQAIPIPATPQPFTPVAPYSPELHQRATLYGTVCFRMRHDNSLTYYVNTEIIQDGQLEYLT